jgi:hypothetical protein
MRRWRSRAGEPSSASRRTRQTATRASSAPPAARQGQPVCCQRSRRLPHGAQRPARSDDDDLARASTARCRCGPICGRRPTRLRPGARTAVGHASRAAVAGRRRRIRDGRAGGGRPPDHRQRRTHPPRPHRSRTRIASIRCEPAVPPPPRSSPSSIRHRCRCPDLEPTRCSRSPNAHPTISASSRMPTVSDSVPRYSHCPESGRGRRTTSGCARWPTATSCSQRPRRAVVRGQARSRPGGRSPAMGALALLRDHHLQAAGR